MTFLLQPHRPAHAFWRNGKRRAVANGGMQVMVKAAIGIVDVAAKVPTVFVPRELVLVITTVGCGAEVKGARRLFFGNDPFPFQGAGRASESALGAKDVPGGRREGIATANFDVHDRRVGCRKDELYMVVGIAQGKCTVEFAKDGWGGGAEELQGLVEKVCASIIQAATAKLLQGLPIPAASKP